MRFRHVVRHFHPAASNLASRLVFACLPANGVGSSGKLSAEYGSCQFARHASKAVSASAPAARSYTTATAKEELVLPELLQAKLQRALTKLDGSLDIFRSGTDQQDIKKSLQSLHSKTQQLLELKLRIPAEQHTAFLFIVLPLLSEAVHVLFRLRKVPEMQEKKYQATYIHARSFLVNLYIDQAYPADRQQELRLLMRVFLLPFDFGQKSVNYSKALQVYSRCRDACEPGEVLRLLLALVKAKQHTSANGVLCELDKSRLNTLLSAEVGRDVIWELMKEVDMAWLLAHLGKMDRSGGEAKDEGLITQNDLKLAFLHPALASSKANALANQLLQLPPLQTVALFRGNISSKDLSANHVIAATILQGRRPFRPETAEKLFGFSFDNLTTSPTPPLLLSACRRLVRTVSLEAFAPSTVEQRQLYSPILIEEGVRRGRLLHLPFDDLTPSQIKEMMQRVLKVCRRAGYKAKRKVQIIRALALRLLPLHNAEVLEDCLRFLHRHHAPYRDLIRSFPAHLRTQWMNEALAISQAPTIWPPAPSLRTDQVIAARFQGLKPYSAIQFYKRQNTFSPVVLLAYARNLARHKRFTLLRRLIRLHPEEKIPLLHILLRGYLRKSSLSWRSLKKIQVALKKLPPVAQQDHVAVNVLFEATVRYGHMSSQGILDLLDRVPEAKDRRDWYARVRPAVVICMKQLRRLGDGEGKRALMKRLRQGDKDFVK